jgi:type IV pilus assembly protein PilO
MAAENPLTKLPLAGQLGIGLGLAAAILGAFWYLWWNPAVAEEAQKTARLEELRDDIKKLEVTASKLEEFKNEVRALEGRLDQLKLYLPPAKETPDLMRKVQYLATQQNLTLKRFNPGATVNRDFYQEYPINIDVEGTFHNLALFFDRLGRMPRLVNAGNVRVRSQGRQTATNTVSASCVATTYVYVEKPPEPPRPGANK